ncbi:nucleotide pyrophosphohydrolase [Microaerobacter geothermalis]|uniref:nucleotide pyrophosphohydrolase n=1 Tax=Microaerobacter geothermalis TaxID=674972 RepID=UPI001F243E51|nr:nucleotide pyrophosphohydrolase [Microaerobacter geothermalis]MCF6093357.1 nucleotide pyrophosphohydrolase [Microaerobacter geothermalis]
MENKELTIREMQQVVDQYITQFKEGYFPPLELMARMAEEVGELAREVTHQFGHKKKKPTEAESSLSMELADCMFIIVCFANSLQIDLETAFYQMMDKYNTRDANRWTRIVRDH